MQGQAPQNSRSIKRDSNWFRKLLTALWAGCRYFAGALLIAWAAFALYYSNLPWAWLRIGLAVAVAGFGIRALWFRREARLKLIFAGLVVGVFVWFLSIRPTLARAWKPEVSVMPRAIIDGDRVRFTGFRNFEYASRNDFTVRYEEREVLISKLSSVDLLISYWGNEAMAHTFLSFNFDDAEPVCISIEARLERGERFAALPAMFKQFELIYVVGDERDVVGLRTNHRGEDVFLYRIKTSSEAVRRLFRIYLEQINRLADRAEFYHLLRNNCTVNIVRSANAAGRGGEFDFRHLLNGYVDRYVYEAGLVDTGVPFEELRRRSRINEAAQAAEDAPDFSRRIRASLPEALHDSGGGEGRW